MPSVPTKAVPTKVIFEARAMLRKGKTMNEIAGHYGYRFSEQQISDELATHRAMIRGRYAKNLAGVVHPTMEARPSPELLAHRERRVMLRPKSITAWVLNDPLPGESALDRRSA